MKQFRKVSESPVDVSIQNMFVLLPKSSGKCTGLGSSPSATPDTAPLHPCRPLTPPPDLLRVRPQPLHRRQQRLVFILVPNHL